MLIRSELITAASSEQITLAEAKLHLRVDHTTDDTLITSLIKVAREEGEAVCGRCFGMQEWALYFDCFHNIKLHGCGIVTAATLHWRDQNGDWQALGTTQYDLVKSVPAKIYLKDSFNVPTTGDYADPVRVTLTCGELASFAVKAWMLLRIGTLYQNREADSERKVEPQTFVPNLLAAHRVIDFS